MKQYIQIKWIRPCISFLLRYMCTKCEHKSCLIIYNQYLEWSFASILTEHRAGNTMFCSRTAFSSKYFLLLIGIFACTYTYNLSLSTWVQYFVYFDEGLFRGRKRLMNFVLQRIKREIVEHHDGCYFSIVDTATPYAEKNWNIIKLSFRPSLFSLSYHNFP